MSIGRKAESYQRERQHVFGNDRTIYHTFKNVSAWKTLCVCPYAEHSEQTSLCVNGGEKVGEEKRQRVGRGGPKVMLKNMVS